MIKIERDFIADFFRIAIFNDVLIYNHDRATAYPLYFMVFSRDLLPVVNFGRTMKLNISVTLF
jgi:hypothetical protein